MKLVDILARELKVWPEDLPHAMLAQSERGSVNYLINNRLKWAMPTSPERAEDWLTAIVTRASWQDAVDALNAPKVVEWGGVGLPPIGMASCEYLGAHKYDEWTVVNIFAHYGHTVFVDFGDGWRAEKDSSRFRPIKTAEQLAEEEREDAANKMFQRFGGIGGLTKKQCIWVISEGYRKQ